jgi:hypothetical protein
MAHHHVTSADIAINGDHLDNSKVAKVKTAALGIAAVGTLISLYLLFFASNATKGLRLLLAVRVLLLPHALHRRVLLDAAAQCLELGLGHLGAPDLSKTSAPPTRGCSCSAFRCSARRSSNTSTSG